MLRPQMNVRSRSCAISMTGGARTSHIRRAAEAATEEKTKTGSPTWEPESAPPPTILNYTEPGGGAQFATNAKLALALPQRRFKQDSYLLIKLEGDIPEKRQSRFSQATSMAALCSSIRKAAYDPRVSGILLNIDLLGIGWAKAQEIRSHIAFFKKSGKATVAFMKRGGEKEYYVATCCDDIYVPPTAQLSLLGLSVSGAFLRGVLDKIGVEPQVQRIGKYKSAGDQLLRTDMSEAQREQLSALLEDIYAEFTTSVAAARGKTPEEVATLLDEGIFDMEQLKAGGWLTDLKYQDEVKDLLAEKTGGDDDEFATVPLRRYQYVDSGAFGLKGKRKVAIVRESGAITGGSKPQGGQIVADPLIKQLTELSKRKDISGIVLRIDSPGGDALASDLMWREIQLLAEKKPLVATMGDVAASGGYYMGMAAPTVVAHPLTITGSIGVVAGKLNFAELFEKVGYSKEVISKGTYAELLQDYRPFNDAERNFFERSAQFSYESFRNKAAASRHMEAQDMQEFAQGRVWSGHRAHGNKLVDRLGGTDAAIALVKEKADIAADEEVTLVEVSIDRPSPTALLSGAGALSRTDLLKLIATDPGFLFGTVGFAVVPLMLQVAFTAAFDAVSRDGAMDGRPQLMLDGLFQSLSDGSVGRAMHAAVFPQATMSSVDVSTSVDAATSIKDLLQ